MTDRRNQPNHHGLCAAAVPWLRRQHCAVVLAEPRNWSSSAGQCPDAIGWPSQGGFASRREPGSVLVEAKASRSDFLADRRKPYHDRPADFPGVRRWYFVADEGVARADDLPPGWGLLVYGGASARHRVVVRPEPFVLSTAGLLAEQGLLLAALRRHHLGAEWLSDEARFVPQFVRASEHRRRLAARRVTAGAQLPLPT